ncbi:MAG: Stp1/IreP family PP2C-type Ser/Thr phosphatase [Eubacteriales bacterium]|nr:Stp1/IreP family PP2C-type Ser/Thr phosphatase [Bacillota bacterium]MDD6916011.1 Stp1/IreP family PP2C-type Ser/Thr phosphatase [Eubacteriales bacterium]MDY4214322.1 Stp1/IreP family PP2C-type Ser/Thr phosphatase [Eubacteriales bacterium]MDY5230732.1 Stp1/IreP family PP2C-type Ser/Thr phosphatase [Eubacteriales bacterium]
MVEVFGLSDVGCIRELNEDCYCICGFGDNSERGFCILADGMGGHNAGEVASQNAVKLIAEEMNRLLESGEKEIPGQLSRAVSAANTGVYTMASENPIHRGMGTTVVTAFIDDGTAYVANVGDSRAYAVRDDEIVQITTDHSVVSELVMRGTITKEEARLHPQKNIITRAVGTDKSVRTDIFEYNYSPGDVMIICSDGLSTMLDDNRILEIIKSKKTSEDTVNSLIAAAKDEGGLDNITVICIRFI